MKVLKLGALGIVGLLLANCGGSSSIVEPATLDGQMIHFAFDKYDITEEARNNLLGQSLYLKNHTDVKNVVIEGHCDERGTAEYNMALGARRANAAKDVIVKDGIDSKRIKTVSYGKERPLVKESNEAAWAKNRRATTVVPK